MIDEKRIVEYLSECDMIQEEIQDWYTEQEEVRVNIESAKAQMISDVPNGKGGHSDLSNKVVYLESIKAKRARKIHEFYDFLLENIERFYNMPDADYSYLLFQQFIMRKPMEAITKQHYISKATSYRYFHRALYQFGLVQVMERRRNE